MRDNGAASQQNRLAKSAFRVVNLVQDVGDAAITVTNDIGDVDLFSADMSPTEVGSFTAANAGFVRIEVRAPSDSEVLQTASVSLDPDTAYSLLVTRHWVRGAG